MKAVIEWVYKIKKPKMVNIYKTRLKVKGYKNREDIDYGEVFCFISQVEIIKLMISLATQHL